MEFNLMTIAPIISALGVFACGVLAYAKLLRVDKAVHLPDGKWRFVPAEDVCKKLDNMEQKIDAMHEKQTKDMENIAAFMGAMKGIMWRTNGG